MPRVGTRQNAEAILSPPQTAMHDALLNEIAAAFDAGVREPSAELLGLVDRFLTTLEAGEIRAAAPDADGVWRVEPRVKQGILVGFRIGRIEGMGDTAGPLHFADKDTFPTVRPDFAARGIRIVPGGSSVRRGAYLGNAVTCMPPMYINVGAYVGEGTMVDSHALVGSCAQIGARVHLSAAAQIGGVLEPIGMRPVVIEDDALIGGGVGIYEGTLVRRGAVIGAGVSLTASTPIYDVVQERILRAENGAPLEVPENAVIVPGSRPLRHGGFATEHGLQIATPILVKYRDDKTDLRAALEGDLR